jgi:hypothetical protein
MRRIIVAGVLSAVALMALGALQPASAFFGNQKEIANATQATSSIIEVKRSPQKPRPPGWSHGRKTGWHGRSKPPGQ